MKINKILIIIATLILFNCLLFTRSGVHAWTETDEPVFVWKRPDPPPFEFNYPSGITFDSEDNMYVCDLDKEENVVEIEKYDSDLDYLYSWDVGSEYLPSLDNVVPYCWLDVDSLDRVYASLTYGDGKIKKFTGSGELLTSWDVTNLYGLAINSVDEIYCSCRIGSDYYICKYDSLGNILDYLETGAVGSTWFYGVAVDSNGNVYASNNEDDIHKFDSSGNYITNWVYPETYSIATDTSNNIYAVVGNIYDFEKFSSTGSSLATYSSPRGILAGETGKYLGDAVVNQGKLFFTDTNNNRIQIFELSLSYDSILGKSGSDQGNFFYPNDIAVGNANGNIIVADHLNNKIKKFDSEGNFVSTSGGFEGSGDGEFKNVYSLELDSHNNIFVLDTRENSDLFDPRNNRIQKFDNNFNYIDQTGSSGSSDGQFEFPTGLGFSSSGSLCVADRNNHRVQLFDLSLNFESKFGYGGLSDGQLAFPSDCAFDSSGNILVSDGGVSYSLARVQKFSSDGVYSGVKYGSFGSGEGQFKEVAGIDLDEEDNLYVADTGNGLIQKFDSQANFLMSFDGASNGQDSFNFPKGVAITENGDLYVADTGNHRILKYSFDRMPAVITVTEEAYEENGNYYLEGTATDDLTPITSIQYQISDGESEWVDCEAVDGAFDELEEEFICNLGSGYEPGSSTEVYIRSTDSRTNTNSTLGTGESTDIAVSEVNVEELPETGKAVTLLYSIALLITLLLTVYYRKRLIGCNEC